VGAALYELALRQVSQSTGVIPTKLEGEVIMEIKFPPHYPYQRPSFRVVKPRFSDLQIDLNPVVNQVLHSSTSPSEEKRQKVEESSKMVTETEPWNSDTSLLEMIQMIRAFIIESKATVETDAGLENYTLSTVGGFGDFSPQCHPTPEWHPI